MILAYEIGTLRNSFPVVVKFQVSCILCVTGARVLNKLGGYCPDFLNKLSWENRLLGARWPVQKKVALFLSKGSLIFSQVSVGSFRINFYLLQNGGEKYSSFPTSNPPPASVQIPNPTSLWSSTVLVCKCVFWSSCFIFNFRKMMLLKKIDRLQGLSQH